MTIARWERGRVVIIRRKILTHTAAGKALLPPHASTTTQHVISHRFSVIIFPTRRRNLFLLLSTGLTRCWCLSTRKKICFGCSRRRAIIFKLLDCLMTRVGRMCGAEWVFFQLIFLRGQSRRDFQLLPGQTAKPLAGAKTDWRIRMLCSPEKNSKAREKGKRKTEEKTSNGQSKTHGDWPAFGTSLLNKSYRHSSLVLINISPLTRDVRKWWSRRKFESKNGRKFHLQHGKNAPWTVSAKEGKLFNYPQEYL